MSRARRVTVVTPDTRVDLALPSQATVAEVVLQIIDLVGPQQLDPAGQANGWTLSRLGEHPLESGRSVGATDLCDGDVLHLSPRNAQLPPALFDDVVDAIAQASASRPDRWTVALTRKTSLATAASLALVALAPLVSLPEPMGALMSLTGAILLILAAAGLSRGVGDATAGAVAGLTALAYAAWASTELVLLIDTPTSQVDRWGAILLVGGAAVALTAVLGGLVVGAYREIFGAALAVSLVGLVGGATNVIWDARPTTTTALIAGVSMLSLPWLPVLSVRLARLPLPVVPMDMDQFRDDEQPTSATEVIARARRGDIVLAWILIALAVVITTCFVVLVGDSSIWSRLLAVLLAVVLILRSRRLIGREQRLVLLSAGLVGVVLAAAVGLSQAGVGWRIAAVPVTLLIAALLVGYAVAQPRRGASPYVARLLDIVEFLSLASLLPLVGMVIGLYARLRSNGG